MKMIEEIRFGKEGSKFTVKQCLALDELIEGKPIGTDYDLILYNLIAPVDNFPILDFFSLLRYSSGKGLAPLYVRTKELKLRTQDSLEVLLSVAGGVAGFFIEGLTGMVLGGLLAGAVAKELSEIYRPLSRKLHKTHDFSIIENIKGLNLFSYSNGMLDINDGIELCFPDYHFLNRFTDSKNNHNENKKILNDVKQKIITKINNSRSDEQKYFYRSIYDAFSESKNLVSLHNKIQTFSKIKKGVKPTIFNRSFNLGHILVTLKRGCSISIQDVKSQVLRSLFNKDYYLENVFALDLKQIINKRKEELLRYGIGDFENEDFYIPFCARFLPDCLNFGVLHVNSETEEIAGGYYFNENNYDIIVF